MILNKAVRLVQAREIAFKTFRGFRAKNFSISTSCLLWRETFLIILPVLKHGAHIVAPTYYFLKGISLLVQNKWIIGLDINIG